MLPVAILAMSALGIGIDGKLNGDEAIRVTEQAQEEYEAAFKKFEADKQAAEQTIQMLGKTKLDIYGTQIQEFITVFSKLKETQLREGKGIQELLSLSLDDKEFEKMQMDSLESQRLLESNPTRDAFLSWGIGGIAGLAFYHAKMKGKRDNAHAELAMVKKRVAEMELVQEQFYIIQENAKQLQNFFERFARIMDAANANLKRVVEKKQNWDTFQEDEKNTIIVAMKTVQILKAMIDLPLLGEDGMLTKDICDILSQRENVLKVFGSQAGLEQN